MSCVVNRGELQRCYPEGVPEDFVPTHRVELLDPRTGEVLRRDLVHVSTPDSRGVRFAEAPVGTLYAILSTGKWQCLVRNGRVRHEAILYQAEYVRPSERDGFVYFVQAGPEGPIKIGWSQDVAKRIAALQVANAARLALLGTIPGRMEDEAATHARFAHLRVNAEWFRDAPELREYLAACGDSPIEEPST